MVTLFKLYASVNVHKLISSQKIADKLYTLNSGSYHSEALLLNKYKQKTIDHQFFLSRELSLNHSIAIFMKIYQILQKNPYFHLIK
ncbi:hypothetical protein BpHYR1_018880 [Brachionus plicatilis]|uniref:Uncharacterized protein n=1 Tax=Brachionus plicatilis TaxID=10195 RepID=A0A3M7PR63_BRAPC|nr:hypothetical protein BpHYR1_018880 [Brachionus plicatilis]